MLKFRVYSIFCEKFIPPDSVLLLSPSHNSCGSMLVSTVSNIRTDRFTGAYDKDGVEVYENDIIDKGTHVDGKPFLYKVVWIDYGWDTQGIIDGDYYNFDPDNEDWVVVGNTHKGCNTA